MRPPGLLSWIAATALFGGISGILVGRRRVRLVCAILALAGLGGTIADLYVRSQRPAAPDLVIRLISPSARTASPMLVRVCGLTHAGSPTPVIGGNRFLLVRVDGVQVDEVHNATVLIPARRGRHLLSVEVNSPDHQEFQPPVLVRRAVDVTGAGTSTAASCPR
jgi:hypothetical protein